VLGELRYELELHVEHVLRTDSVAGNSSSDFNGQIPSEIPAAKIEHRTLEKNSSDAARRAFVNVSNLAAPVVVRMSALHELEGQRVALRVRALTSEGWPGLWSNMSIAVTVPGRADAPQLYLTSGKGPHDQALAAKGFLQLDIRPSAHVSYDAYPPLHIVRFDVHISETAMGMEASDWLPACLLQLNASVFSIQPHSHRLNHFEIGMTYYVRVRAVTEVGPGNWSATVAKTLVVPPSGIRNETWHAVAPLTVNVSWLPPHQMGCGFATACSPLPQEQPASVWYRVAISRLVPSSPVPLLTEASGSDIFTATSSHVFSNLSKGQSFWVQVRAENLAALGVPEWSSPLLIISADLPSEPRNLQLARGGSAALRLTWLRPADTGTGDDSYPLSSFQVQLVAFDNTLNPIYTSFDVTHELPIHSVHGSHTARVSAWQGWVEAVVIGPLGVGGKALPVGVPLSARMRSQSGTGSSNWTRWTSPVVPILFPSPPRNVTAVLASDSMVKTLNPHPVPNPAGSRFVSLGLLFSEPAETGQGRINGSAVEPILAYSITITVSGCQPQASTAPLVPQHAPVVPVYFRAQVGCAYRMEVRAVSALGAGDPAVVSLTAVTSASAPRMVRMELTYDLGVFGIFVAWLQPQDAGTNSQISAP
jgi:hypothetical protein